MFSAPLLWFVAPCEFAELLVPPLQLPVIFNVPVELLSAPGELLPLLPPCTLPIIEHDCPVVRLEVKHGVFTAPVRTPVPVQVNVIPLVGTKDPPAVTPVALALLIDNTVGLVSIVTVNVLL